MIKTLSEPTVEARGIRNGEAEKRTERLSVLEAMIAKNMDNERYISLLTRFAVGLDGCDRGKPEFSG